MAYEHKPGSFSLYKNKDKDNDRHPDYKGYGKDADGNDIEVAAWIKRSEGRDSFMSCSFKLKQAKTEQKEHNPKKPFDDMESDVPF